MSKFTTTHIVQSGTVVLIGTLFANVIHYGFNMFMTRALTPSEYAILVTIISLISIIGVPMRTATTVAAKHTSFVLRGYTDYLIATLLVGVGIMGLYFFLIPFLSSYLTIPWQALLMISPIILVTPSLCMNMGIIQGLRKISLFSTIPALEAAIKLGCAAVFVIIGYALLGALGSITITVVVSWVITSTYLLRTHHDVMHTESSSSHIPDQWKSGATSIFISSMAIALLGNMDIIAAKHFFSGDAAGQYSVLAVISRTISYGSLIMIPVLFPAMSQAVSAAQARIIFRKGLTISIIAAALILLLFRFYPAEIVALLPGPQYTEIIPYLVMAGATTALWSISQIFLSYFIAVDTKHVLLPLLTITGLQGVGIALFHQSIWSLVLTTLTAEAVLLVVFIGIFVHEKRTHA